MDDQAKSASGNPNDTTNATTNQDPMSALMQQLVTSMQRQNESQAQMMQMLTASMQQLNNGPRDSGERSPSGRDNGQNQRSMKPPEPNKPPILEADISLEQFDSWHAAGNDYAACLQFDQLPVEQQIARFRTFMSLDMKSEVVHGVGIKDDEAILPPDALSRIRAYIRGKRNIAVDKVAFEEYRQEEGQSFDDYYIKLAKIASNADLCEHCVDTKMATKIMVGISDSDTRKKLLAIKPFPELTTVLNVCRSEESAKKNEELLTRSTKEETGVSALKFPSKPNNTPKTEEYRQKTKHQQPGTSQSSHRPDQAATRSNHGQCNYCGFPAHARQFCPASNETCNTCGKIGHFARVCLRRNQQPREGPKSASHVSFDVSAVSNHTIHKASRIYVDIYGPKHGKYMGCILATPDSAAEGTVAGRDIMERLKIREENLEVDNKATIRAANQGTLTCLGSIELTFKLCGTTVTDRVFFCEQAQGILLPWYLCQDLHILCSDYPNPVKVNNLEIDASGEGDSFQSFGQVLGEIPQKPTENEKTRIKNVLMDHFSDVFDTEEVLKPMKCPPMVIQLKQNAVLHAVKVPRQIPVCWRDKAKAEIDLMVKQKIIAPVGDQEVSEWCHPLVCVSKGDGGVRICVDMTRLNPHVIRPIHPFPSPREAVSNIPNNMQYLSILDARKGYWQLEIDEKSEACTTFLTPWGRFKYFRAPMGLTSTGDEFCRQGDLAFKGIGNLQKAVDDTVEFDQDFRNHVKRMWATLMRCREHNITMNPKKFVFAQSEVKFCGYVIGASCIKPDPEKLEAISKFPVPETITDIRSFMGLVNQICHFTKEINKTAEPLRDLLSTKNAFYWDSEKQIAFDATKRAVCNAVTLVNFDPILPTRLHVDASRKNGLGYVLTQKHPDTWKVVDLGSRFLSPAETRYSMPELELLGVVSGTQSCKIYLQGLSEYVLLTDHKPLIPILDKYTIADIENPRLQRLKEKLPGFVFKTKWLRAPTTSSLISFPGLLFIRQPTMIRGWSGRFKA